LKTEIGSLCLLLIIVTWLGGAVLAKGFWLTAAAVVFPPYAWYLVVELAMRHWGLV
jgi:hypothetical protein